MTWVKGTKRPMHMAVTQAHAATLRLKRQLCALALIDKAFGNQNEDTNS